MLPLFVYYSQSRAEIYYPFAERYPHSKTETLNCLGTAKTPTVPPVFIQASLIGKFRVTVQKKDPENSMFSRSFWSDVTRVGFSTRLNQRPQPWNPQSSRCSLRGASATSLRFAQGEFSDTDSNLSHK